jgi:hypothetical protein
MSEPQSVEAQLAVINVKLDTLLATQNDHEPRIRKLETFKWIVLGAAVASGPVFSAIGSKIPA